LYKLIERKKENLPDLPQFLSKHDFLQFKRSSLLDISHWSAVWDVTLTMKQARRRSRSSGTGQWAPTVVKFSLNEEQCRRAFHHFMNLLNRAVFGKAFYRHRKRLNVIPILEKEFYGRWHYHAAIEPPSHLRSDHFKRLIQDCWKRTDWGYDRVKIREEADRGWVNYMLKPSQKSAFDAWSDCIDWDSLNNRSIVGV
jgi:hypothetical protein